MKDADGNATSQHCLPREEILQLGSDGDAGSFTPSSPEEMVSIREKIESDVLASDSPFPHHRHPPIDGRLAGVCGPSLLLASALFVKSRTPSRAAPAAGAHDDLGWPVVAPPR